MFINKINGLQNNQSFKGYQHKINDVGEQVLEFNFPYDHTKEKCYVEFFKLKPNDKSMGGYDVLEDKCIARQELSPNGKLINLQELTTLDEEEPYAYRIVKESLETGNKTYIADTGLKLFKDHSRNIFAFDHDPQDGRVYNYTLVSRKSTSPLVYGSGLAVFPDSLPGYKFNGFKDMNTGSVYFDEKLQKELSDVPRTYSNKFGGNIAGLVAIIDYMNSVGHKTLFANPIANGDDLSSHHYWNKNNFRVSKDMGSVNDFRYLARSLFQNGKRFIFDYTLTGEGLEGINFQHAMRWKGKNPESQYCFRMDNNVLYGILPKNHENLRFKVINPMEIYEQTKDGHITIKRNPNYRADRETYFQVYDDSQVSEHQRHDLTKKIRAYENIKPENELDINSHDDTIVPFAFEIDPKAYGRRLRIIKELNEKEGQNIQLNSAEGTKVIAQFDNLKLAPKVETGTVNFDANTDLIKKRHDVSSYDERNILAMVTEKERKLEREKMRVGANQVTSMDCQTVQYWTKLYNDANVIYTAKTLGNTKTVDGINSLIKKGLLPEEAVLSNEALENIINDEYLLEPKGIDERDTVTVRSLMQLSLESLELGENTLGVLARSYFSPRAREEEHVEKSRFELMEMENPHLVDENADTYLKINELFINDVKDFADEVIKLVNEKSKEKLIDEDGEYTEYGEYVINLLGQDIARYVFLKAIAGSNLDSKIRNDGFIEYDVEKLEENTTLKGLGINALDPKDEAVKLEKVISAGMKNLSLSDIRYVASSVSKIIEGTNTTSFKLAEAMVQKSGLGMGARLDAAKDVIDNDSVRDGGNSIDDSIEKNNRYYRHITSALKSVDKHAPIIAEYTDMAQLYEATYSKESQVYGDALHKAGGKYINTPDGMAKIFNESGITSEAAYSYFFTDFVKAFTYDFESGEGIADAWSIKSKISELLRTRNLDYIRNLYTFLSNHDKPRVLQGLAINQPLFYSDFKFDYPNGIAQFQKKRNHRESAAMILSGVTKKEDLPIETRLNMDRPEYFRRVSSEAIAMAEFIKHSVNKNLQGIATEEQIKELNLAIKDLANGVYLGKGEVDELQDISIKELTSLKSAFEKMVAIAEEKHALKLSPEEKTHFINEVVERANREGYVSKFVLHGDFNWTGPNNKTGLDNRLLAQSILEKYASVSESGKAKANMDTESYNQYSLYTANLIGLLRNAMLDTQVGQNSVVQSNMFAAMKDFFEKYDRKTVEESRTRKLFVDDAQAIKANAFAAKEIRRAIQMVVKQVEYRTGKPFENKDTIVDSIYIPAMKPAVVKMQAMTKFLAAVLGTPYIYWGDEMGVTGGERKARNLDLQNRNAIPLHLMTERSPMGDFARNAMQGTNYAISLRNRPDTEPLRAGTPYEMKAGYIDGNGVENSSFPAYLVQASNGDANIVIMSPHWLKQGGDVDYYNTPEQTNMDLDFVEFTSGAALAAGTVFMNINPKDKARYIVESAAQGVYKLVKENCNKLSIDKFIDDKGVMVLKKIPFRGRNNNLPKTINSRYNFSTNLYERTENSIAGEKLSLISK